MAKDLPSMCEALCSIPSTEEEREGEKNGGREGGRDNILKYAAMTTVTTKTYASGDREAQGTEYKVVAVL